MPHPKDQESGKGDVASPPQDKTACSSALAWQMLRTFLWFNPLIWIRNLVLHLIFLSEATCYRNPQGENAKKRITGLLTLLESKEKASPEIPSFRGLHESGHPPLSIIVLHRALNSVFSLLNLKLKCFSFWVDFTFQYVYFWRSRTTIRHFLLSLLRLFWFFSPS